MAFNIDLSKRFRPQTIEKSPVDSRIVLNKAAQEPEIYSDLKLDFDIGNMLNPALNAVENNSDLTKITNEECVITALRNIMNTNYNTRLLNPEMDFDLRKYLFEPINAPKAYLIGYDLTFLMKKYDDRVKLNKVKISTSFDSNAYLIEMEIAIPSLNKTISLSSILNQDGYYINN